MTLHPTLATIRRNLPGVARSLGFQARVTSGYRSTKKQAWLYNRYLQGLQPYPVAPPGTSDHEYGLALDVVSTDTAKLVALLSSVGLFWAGPDDPVHFSLKPRYEAPAADSGQSVKKSDNFLLELLTYQPWLALFIGKPKDPKNIIKPW